MTMKKYIMPKTHCINLSGEESVLLNASINAQAEDVDVMTKKQETNSSIWDNWSE